MPVAVNLTFDKTDEKNAVIIARLAAQLRCYAPGPVDETWGKLRHFWCPSGSADEGMTAQVQ